MLQRKININKLARTKLGLTIFVILTIAKREIFLFFLFIYLEMRHHDVSLLLHKFFEEFKWFFYFIRVSSVSIILEIVRIAPDANLGNGM